MYWVSTACAGGKPHAAPVWGIWDNDKFYFETDPKSPKGRNLASNPRIVFHVQDGLDTVIVEGTAEKGERPKKIEALERAVRSKVRVQA